MSARPADALDAAGERQPVLFAPRVWGALSDGQRADPRAFEVRYVFDPRDLAAIGDVQGWSRLA